MGRVRRVLDRLSIKSKSAKHREGDASTHLCLKCRQPGHVFDDCLNEWFTEIFITSDRRKGMDFGSFDDLIDQPLCLRCQDLDILTFLGQDIPWTSGLHLYDGDVRASGVAKSLGQVGTVVFKQDCSLCRCLFAMTPEPDSDEQEVMLLPSWTMCRLEGGISIDTPEKKNFTRCLLVTLDPTLNNLTIADYAQRSDALCIMQEDNISSESTLGGRIIDPQVTSIESAERWISTCDRLHPVTCKVNFVEELKNICLIDVQSRQLVQHPDEQCEYLALSYVWGGIEQPSYSLGETLVSVPKTIEDAITFTIKMGTQYLWVDSICIEQNNEGDKALQLRLMSAIYEGASATIVAMSGKSANSGLPRMRPGEDKGFPQLKCCIDGKRLVGLMPTLSQLVWISSWGDRAWTLQEALLSRRCIYLSDHQILFECNAIQCSEALDESSSWVHQLLRDAEFMKNGHSEAVVGAGVLRSPFVGIQHTNDRLQQYTVLVNLYSGRNMTFPDDALNGFTGILQYLTRLEYKQGFFWGLPLEDMNWALGWGIQEVMDRRANFPSWSWSGWKGRISELVPIEIKKPHFYQVPLSISKLNDERQLVTLLLLPLLDLKDKEVLHPKHPFKALIESHCADSHFDIESMGLRNMDSWLFVEGLVFTFKPDWSNPRDDENGSQVQTLYDMEVGSVAVLLSIDSVDSIVSDVEFETIRGLLLARDRAQWGNYYYLLVLRGDGLILERKSVITFQTEADDEALWEHLDVEKRRIVLT